MSENVSSSHHVFERGTQENTWNFTMANVLTSSDDTDGGGGWTLDRTPWIPALVMAVAMVGFLSLSFYNHHKRVRRKKEIIMDYLTTLLYSDVWSRGRSVSILCHTNSISFDELGRSFKVKSREEKEPQDIMREKYIKDLVATISKNKKASLKRIVSAPNEYRFNRVSGPITADKKAFSMSLMDANMSTDAGQLELLGINSVTQGSLQCKGSVSNGILLNPKARFYNAKCSVSFHGISHDDQDNSNDPARGEISGQPWQKAQPKFPHLSFGSKNDDAFSREQGHTDYSSDHFNRASDGGRQHAHRYRPSNESQTSAESVHGRLERAKALHGDSWYGLSSDDPELLYADGCPERGRCLPPKASSTLCTAGSTVSDCNTEAPYLNSMNGLEKREVYINNTNPLPLANYRKIRSLTSDTTNTRYPPLTEITDKFAHTLVDSPTHLNQEKYSTQNSANPVCPTDIDHNNKVSFWMQTNDMNPSSDDDSSEQLCMSFVTHSSGSLESCCTATGSAGLRAFDRLDTKVYVEERSISDPSLNRSSPRRDYNPMLPAEIQAMPQSSSLQTFLPVILSGHRPSSTTADVRPPALKTLKASFSVLAKSPQAVRKHEIISKISVHDSKDSSTKLRSILKKTVSTQSTAALLPDGNMTPSGWRNHEFGSTVDDPLAAQDMLDSVKREGENDRPSPERCGREHSFSAAPLPKRLCRKGATESSNTLKSFPETTASLWDLSGSTGTLGTTSSRSWSAESSGLNGLRTALSLEALTSQGDPCAGSRFGSNLHRLPRFQVRSGLQQQRQKFSDKRRHVIEPSRMEESERHDLKDVGPFYISKQKVTTI